MLLYENKVPTNAAAFADKVRAISADLNIDPNWLMAVINWESAGTFSPSIQNPDTGATGLIQFMRSTAASLGTTIEALKGMSAIEQLDYVKKYYMQYKSHLVGFVDLYLATLFPAAMAKPDEYVLQTKGIAADTIARANPAFDVGKKGFITVGDVKSVMLAKVPDNWRETFKKKATTSLNTSAATGSASLSPPPSSPA